MIQIKNKKRKWQLLREEEEQKDEEMIWLNGIVKKKGHSEEEFKCW